MCYLARRSQQYNRDSAVGLTRGVDPGKDRVCNLSNFLTFLLWVWVTIVCIGNGVVLKSIQDEMKLLGSGVTTNPALGLSTLTFPDESHSHQLSFFLSRLFDRFLVAYCRRRLYPGHYCSFRSPHQNKSL
jgi:hypothetical protein